MDYGAAFGCGQCLMCRINRKRLWATRLMLENSSHEFSCFLTLTYSDDHLPAGGTLVPHHTRDYLKRLRKALHPRLLRYYYVGEYGDHTQRPHYHMMLFGVSHLEHELLNSKWGYGLIHLGEVTPQSCDYIAGYVTKKLTKSDDPRLEGRHPEFSRQSNRPGIGAHAADCIADALTTKTGSLAISLNNGEPPNEIHTNGKKAPLGRYLKTRIRKRLDLPQLGIHAHSFKAQQERLQDLLGDTQGMGLMAQKSKLISKTEQRVKTIANRGKIFQSTKQGKWL